MRRAARGRVPTALQLDRVLASLSPLWLGKHMIERSVGCRRRAVEHKYCKPRAWRYATTRSFSGPEIARSGNASFRRGDTLQAKQRLHGTDSSGSKKPS